MFEWSTLSAFVAVVLGLFLIPGPAVLLVLTRTVQGGRRSGIFTGLGIAAGDLVHTTFAAVGLSTLLMTSAVAFTIVKLLGAAYLVYLGIRALMAKPTGPALPKVAPTAPVVSSRAFAQAVLAEVLNPKTALFFLAFIPQFVHASQGSPFVQFAVLGLVFSLLSALYTTLLVLTIRPLGRFVKRLSWLVRWQNKIVGVVFVSLGLRVAAQHR
jgi:threonine/homoserine/homoserine lactone efflux protein